MAKNSKRIAGVKFFQKHLDFLKLYFHEYETEGRTQPLPASAIVTFILYHFVCDSYGKILTSEFNLKGLAERYNLPYSSIHRGHHLLMEKGLLKTEVRQEQEYYSIHCYDEYNDVERNGGGLNYFLIPYYIIENGALADFITHRDASGLIELLSLINTTYRQFQMHESNRFVIGAQKLMDHMKKSTRNIINWLKRASNFIKFKEIEGRTRRQKIFELSLVEGCFSETQQDARLEVLIARLRKDIEHQFTNSPIRYKEKDKRDVLAAVKQDLLKVFYPLSYLKTARGDRVLSHIINHAHLYAFKKVVDRVKNIQKPIKSIGAYYRNQLRSEIIYHWHRTLDDELRSKVASLLGQDGKRVPKFIADTY